MNALLVAFGFPVQYRALRCAAKAGLRMSVMGGKEASLLRFSHHCKRYVAIPALLDRGDAVDEEEWLRLIEERVSKWNIELVIPADAASTRILARIRSRISIPVFPILEPDKFELLNNKWSFYQLCCALGLLTPQTWLFPDRASLLAALRMGELPEQLIAKPTNMWGGMGVIPFVSRSAAHEVDRVNYEPILIQEYIEGSSITLSIYTSGGRVIASAVHRAIHQQFIYSLNEELLRSGSTIAAHLMTDGILNFDAQLTADGKVYLLECNPRVYLTMDYAAIAGINFVDLGLRNWSNFQDPPKTIHDKSVRSVLGLARALIRPWQIQKTDLRMAWFSLTDPIPYIIEIVRLLRLRFITPSGIRRM